MREDLERIADMVGAITRIVETAKAGRQAFDEDADKQDAILYRLQTIGEAANRLSTDFRDQHPDVPWQARLSIFATCWCMAMTELTSTGSGPSFEGRVPQLATSLSEITS